MLRTLIRCSEYPSLLREIKKPPELLYSEGNLNELNSVSTVAIVGSRNCDRYGSEVAFELAYQLSKLGVCIVSGLAYGIDTAAHLGALKGEGKIPTVAVLAQGLQTDVYPRKNYQLVQKIIEQGGVVVSHFAPSTPPLPQYFLERNRVIAGLSTVVVVVQANKKSGSLVTARFALEEGREVCVVPGEITNPRSAGTNHLIQEGATLVTSAEDILNASQALSHLVDLIDKNLVVSDVPLSDHAKIILKILKQESPLHFEEIYEKHPNSSIEIQKNLLELELIEAISRQPGNYFTITIKGSRILTP